MYVIVWRFVVKRGREREFEEHYGSSGTWASLFGRGDGFIGTELIRDAADPRRFITVDRWRSQHDFERFRTENRDEYERIDALCDELTESEERLSGGEIEALPLHGSKS